MIMRLIINCLVFLLVCILPFSNGICQPGISPAKDKNAEKLKLSRKYFWDNPPKPSGFVNDYDNIYSDSEEIILDSLIADFEKRTTIQIAVAAFDTLMTSSDSLDALTLRLGNVWGVGQKDKNNGIIIGICIAYRKMRIQNGYGIEKILTDAETKEIIDKAFLPGFRNNAYYEGTFNGLTLLMSTLEKKL